MTTSNSFGCDFLIFCPLVVEWDAVTSKLLNRSDVSLPVSPTERGTIGPYEVVAALIGKGQKTAAAVVPIVLNHFRPERLAVVGVAGGLRDLRLGDVVVANYIYGLGYGKIEGGQFYRRADFDAKPPRDLLVHAQVLAERAEQTWQLGIAVERPDAKSKSETVAKIGCVGSGDFVLDDPSYPFFADAQKTAPEMVAIEMEGAGAAAAVHVSNGRGVLMVRGISDLPAQSTEAGSGKGQRTEWKAYAAAAAASFIASLIERFPQRKSTTSPYVVPALPDKTHGTAVAVGVVDDEAETLLAALDRLFSNADYVARPARSTAVPVPVSRRVSRTSTVRAIQQLLASRSWVALASEHGTGKTQLGILVAEAFEQREWFASSDFRSKETFDARCRGIVGRPLFSEDELYRCVGGVATGRLFIFDGIPDLLSDDSLARSVMALVREVVAGGAKILSLSIHNIPTHVRAVVRSDQFEELPTQGFTDEEAVELLRAYEAPESFSEKVASVLNVTCGGHAMLLAAAAEYLRIHEWRLSAQELMSLFRFEHVPPNTRNEVLRRFFADVADADARALLARLRLAAREVTFETIEQLALVQPQIRDPRYRLTQLVGVWIQERSPGRYVASPLVNAMPVDLNDEQIVRRCHEVLGDANFLQRRVDQYDVAYAVVHYFQGRCFGKLGAVLGFALTEIKRAKAWNQVDALQLWSTTPLPSQIELATRIYIRVCQLVVARARGEDVAFLQADLDKLVAEAGRSESWVVWVAAFEEVQSHGGYDRFHTTQLLQRAVKLLPNDGRIRVRDRYLPQQTWSVTLQQHARRIHSTEDLWEWISLVSELPATLIAELFREPEDAANLVNGLWLRESRKAPSDQNWNRVRGELDRLNTWASERRVEIVTAYGFRAHVVILGEFENRLEDAVRFGRDQLQTAKDTASRFLLKEIIGAQYFYKDRLDEALDWLTAALDEPPERLSMEKVWALVKIATINSRKQQFEEATAAASKAVSIAREAAFDHLRIQALGELGTAEWERAGITAAFGAWDEGAEHLYSHRLDSPLWRGLAFAFRAVLSYPAILARTGRVPAGVSERPTVGFVSRDFAAVAEYYRPSFKFELALTQGWIAAAAGDSERTRIWIFRALEEARSLKDDDGEAIAGIDAIPFLLVDNRFEDALDLVHKVVQQNRASGGDDAADDLFVNYLLLVAVYLWRLRYSDQRQFEDGICRLERWLLTYQPNRPSTADVVATIRLESMPGSLGSPRANLLRDLAESVSAPLPIKDRARVHLVAGVQVNRRRRLWGVGYELVMIPFFFEYWIREATKNAFRFSMPNAVRTGLIDATQAPVDNRLQRILKLVSDGLGLRPDHGFREWFEGRTVD